MSPEHPDRPPLQASALSLTDGLQLSGLTPRELWVRYFGISGNAGETEVEAYAQGLLYPGPHEHDLIAQALNDYFIDSGAQYRAAYHPGLRSAAGARARKGRPGDIP